MTTVTGTENIGSSLTISKSFFVLFSQNVPRQSNSMCFSRRFIVLINRVIEVGFDCTVKRNDQQTGWTQEPILTWEATGDQVPEAIGSEKLGPSTKNEINIQVKFPPDVVNTTTVTAWVKGKIESPARFSATVNNKDYKGFECTVRRMDRDDGWSQDPTLFWHYNWYPLE
ncbi:unnamed protein product [Clavelina lepadiformis]|uniref:Uncharacterized protein n=1 Tax=Clavelina lepadiformis TaxID=159417 RepID=A0ABP0F4M9_CLALP